VIESCSLPAYRHCYVHVPFCTRRCSYCDFAIAVRRVVPVADYVRGVASELQARGFEGGVLDLDTLYFGGGTPSSLGAAGAAQLMAAMRDVATLSEDAEVTLEANPEDLSRDAVRGWREAGINRLSIGIQTFDDAVLQWMHRTHSAADAARAVDDARAGGIDAVSLDLIFALPTELQRDWKRDLEQALALAPDHISLYGLTIEPHTPVGRWQARGSVTEAPDDRYEHQFLLAHDLLSEAGYEHYEVSNFARAGKRAVHNSAYWRGVPYLGVGPSAHGFDGETRRWNVAPYAGWLDATSRGADPELGFERLTAVDRLTEDVYLGLRTRDGLKTLPVDAAVIDAWSAAGWLEPVPGADAPRVRCTPHGWLRLDRLAADLTALRSH
jgi:oxygen-independent coproporphyrinogen-3 oxidase